MTKSATDVMQEIVFSAVIDAVAALKVASKGVPNTMLRDLQAIHANTTFADLPKELQAAIGESVRAAFTRLLKEGYAVAPKGAEPPRPAVRREGEARPPEPRGPRRSPERRPPAGGGSRSGGPPRGPRGKPRQP